MINMISLEEETDTDLIFVRNDKSDIIDVDDLNPKVTNLVIFDDFVTEKDQKKLKSYL